MPLQPLSRRTFLRGVGVTLALPMLDAMRPLRLLGGEASGAPKRFAFIYTPNGYYQPTFLPTISGTEWEMTPTLEPLQDVKADVTVITGLDREFAPGTGVHAQAGACWLTSSAPDEALDGGFPTNITVDQLLARRIGQDSPLPSLELSCNDHVDNRETRYFESISWYGPGYPAVTEKDPRAVFRRLFGKPRGGESVTSVLDAVLEDARSLSKRVGHEDRVKVSEYLDSVRETERRIQLAERAAVRARDLSLTAPAAAPTLRGEYIDLMMELSVLAFQLDLTRVITIVIDPERWDSPRMYDGVFDSPQNHHALTHTKGDDAARDLAKIDKFHVERFAQLTRRLKSIPEGNGTLLDSCLITMGSGISDGRIHDYGDLDLLIAGLGGGGITPGRHISYQGDVPLANLWLTLLNSAGVDLKRLADSTGTLSNLRV